MLIDGYQNHYQPDSVYFNPKPLMPHILGTLPNRHGTPVLAAFAAIPVARGGVRWMLS